MRKPLFDGLIVDEFDRPVEVAYVGADPCYVIDDDGFRRHIDSARVDRQVLQALMRMIEGSEEAISEQAAKILGQDDIFTRASISQQMKNMDKHFDHLLEVGLPEDQRAFMGMLGFRVRISIHGDVIDIEQPGLSGSDDDL